MANIPYVESDLEVTLGVGVNLRSGQRAGDWRGNPVSLKQLAAVPSMASVIHTAEAVALPQTYASLYAWTQTNAYQVAGPFREIYLPEAGASTAPASQSDASLIEVQCPVERASIPLSLMSKKEESMDPKIITKPAFKTVGLSYIGKNEHDEIGKMWGQFIPRINEPKRINPQVSYGLCFSEAKGAKEGEFEYIAAVEVADDKNIPAGMVYREVPEQKYAVFTHHGKLDTCTIPTSTSTTPVCQSLVCKRIPASLTWKCMTRTSFPTLTTPSFTFMLPSSKSGLF